MAIDLEKLGNILLAEALRDRTVIGPKGDKGDQGDKGDSIKGDRGERGIPGERGLIGLIGPQGPIGRTGERGSDGKDGKDGKAGPRGRAGANGADGANGRSVIWRDAWDPSTEYHVNDGVEFDGSSYIAIADSIGEKPTNKKFWSLMAKRGETRLINMGGGGNPGGGGATGTVTGPLISVADDFAFFDGVTGTKIKDSGISRSTDGTLAGNSDLKIPTEKAVKTAIDAEAATRSAADASEASTRASADTALASSISSEASTRAAADATFIVGPGSAVNLNLVQFDTTTGKLAKDSGVAPSTDGTFAANSDAKLPTEKAVKTYVGAFIAAADVMKFIGVIDCSANPNFPAADAGNLYRVSVAGKIGGASGDNVEFGDELLCLVDGSLAGTKAAVGANWNISQANIDGAVTGPASATGDNIATYNGATGKIIKDSGKAFSTDGTLAGNSDALIPTQKATKTYSDTKILGPGAVTANDIVQFSGTTGLAVIGGKSFDTDGLLAANSDAKIATQKATKTYIDAQNAVASLCNFLLTTETGVPLSTSDRTAQGTIYLTPYKGDEVGLYDGTKWNKFSSTSDISLALTVTSGKNYDVFLYSASGTLTLELSAAWTNDTTRADALVLQDGIKVKSGATTRRLVGTIRASGTNVTADTARTRFVWSATNHPDRSMEAHETGTATWTYTTATWREANGSTTNQIEWVTGDIGTYVEANVMSRSSNSTATIQRGTGIGVDSTSAISATGALTARQGAGAAIIQTDFASYRGTPGLGYHFLAWLEFSVATGTVTWQGDTDNTIVRPGIIGRIVG